MTTKKILRHKEIIPNYVYFLRYSAFVFHYECTLLNIFVNSVSRHQHINKTCIKLTCNMLSARMSQSEVYWSL